MTKKDITLLSISVVIVAISIFFIIKMMGLDTKKPQQVEEKNTQVNTEITGKFDEDTLSKLKSYKDYGGAELNNIGRVNPFGPLN